MMMEVSTKNSIKMERDTVMENTYLLMETDM